MHISDWSSDVCSSDLPFSQAARFVQSYFRYIRGDHAMSVLRQENAVAPFTIGYCQNLRSRRAAVRFPGQKRIWLGAEEVLVRRVARVPECGLIGFKIGSASWREGV